MSHQDLMHLRYPLFILALTLCLPVVVANPPVGETPVETESLQVEGFDVSITRHGKSIRLSWPSDKPMKERKMPRFFNSIRDVRVTGSDDAEAYTVTPEPDFWRVHRTDKKPWAGAIDIRFDREPLLETEVQPLTSESDGTFVLRAESARVKGEKVRFEPQPHKNTVGYWVGKQDTATWQIRVDKPNTWNLGILQGCGDAQAGSEVTVSVLSSEDQVVSSVDFEVIGTGHFQNFVWRHVGKLTIDKPGTYQIRIAPKRIAKNALMDVRMMHLSPTRP